MGEHIIAQQLFCYASSAVFRAWSSLTPISRSASYTSRDIRAICFLAFSRLRHLVLRGLAEHDAPQCEHVLVAHLRKGTHECYTGLGRGDRPVRLGARRGLHASPPSPAA